MPVALKIPSQEGVHLRLRRGHHPQIRGPKARRAARQEIETRQRTNEGILHTVLICTTLWSGFWVQFLAGMPFNLPAIHTLSGGAWFAPQIGCYLPSPGPLPDSIAGNFLLVSVLGAAVAMVGGWHFTRRVAGRWRMRLAVLAFASLLVGWAMATAAAEPEAWRALEQERKSLQQQLDRTTDPEWRPRLRHRLKSIDAF